MTGHYPSCHASQIQQEDNLAQLPAPQPRHGCDTVQIRSSLQCSESQHYMLPGHIYACPFWSGSLAPDLLEEEFIFEDFLKKMFLCGLRIFNFLKHFFFKK